MALLIATPGRDSAELARCIRQHDPGIDLRIWPELGDPVEIVFVLAWRPPTDLFRQLPNLRAVSSLGAGVDALLGCDIPADAAIGRLAGPRLATDMAAYLVAVVVAQWKQLPRFMDDQRHSRWNSWAPASPPTVGLLGTGAMGRRAAAAFAELEFPLHGYSRSGRGPAGMIMHSGVQGLTEIAGACDFLINLLPLTDQTRDILDRDLFACMPEESTLVNVGRGEHLVETDLLEALDRNRPGHAVLDVFGQEPLPAGHPFWRHPQVLVTPHCAAITQTREAAELAARSYRKVVAGAPPLGCVDRTRGY